jgi:hypothetical protein
MDGLTKLLIVAVVLGVIGVYLSSMAGRLDRLHHRIETTHAGLDAQLLRRVAAAQDLAASGLLDPASSLLLSASAQESFAADPDDDVARLRAESELTRTLGAVFADPEDVDAVRQEAGPDVVVADQMISELAVACRRVELARRFHNDVVRSCVQLRRKRIARWFRLAGHTPLPTTADFDDTVPAGLEGC